jgi:nucleotide-binding universal stress UspA family protein
MKDIQARPFHRIVVGVDGSTSSAATLEWAAKQAKLTGSSLEVVTTWEWPTNYGWAMALPSDFDPKADITNDVIRVVKVAQDAGPDVVMHTHVVEGHPAPTLVQASYEADLLVVGSTGYGELAGMLLGSVSEHCAHHARCPVAIIR